MIQDKQIEFYKEQFAYLKGMLNQLEDGKSKTRALVKLSLAYKWTVESIKGN